MRKKLVAILIFSLIFNALKAQTQKPGVLVIGNSNAAAAAAIQSAVSGAKTTILLQAGGFDISPIANNLSSGIEAEFLARLAKAQNKSAAFNKQQANDILRNWTDSLKNLTVIKNVLWVKASENAGSWSLALSDGTKLKAKILINVGDTKLFSALAIAAPKIAFNKLDYQQTLHRTSVAAGNSSNGTTANFLSLYQFFEPNHDNFIGINDNESMLLGQAAGATAAYAAFFDKKITQSNLKAIQGELINYKLNIMPFADIKITDANWKAIQFVGVTGALKADIKGNEALFMPNQMVTTEEIKQPFKDFYYKAQIWFDDYKNPAMTIGSALDMICYVGNKSLPDTKKLIEKNWTKTYQFSTAFDVNRPITRREFAVLLQEFMPPFNVNVNQAGKVMR